MIGSGVDFDSDPITIIFGVGEMNKRVNISVSCDEEVENEERFDIYLSLMHKISQVSLRRNEQRTIGRITDTTGKNMPYAPLYVDCSKVQQVPL